MTALPLTFDEVLTTTRTVRKRLDLTRPVPMSLIRECLEIARQAPSGSNRQGWEWLVITDPEQQAAIGEICRRATYEYLDSGASATNLYADDPERSRGLGTAWTTLHLKYEAEVAALLGLPEGIAQAALVPTAYYTGETSLPAVRTPLDDVRHLDRW